MQRARPPPIRDGAGATACGAAPGPRPGGRSRPARRSPGQRSPAVPGRGRARAGLADGGGWRRGLADRGVPRISGRSRRWRVAAGGGAGPAGLGGGLGFAGGGGAAWPRLAGGLRACRRRAWADRRWRRGGAWRRPWLCRRRGAGLGGGALGRRRIDGHRGRRSGRRGRASGRLSLRRCGRVRGRDPRTPGWRLSVIGPHHRAPAGGECRFPAKSWRNLRPSRLFYV